MDTHFYVSVGHALAIAPALIYIGLAREKLSQSTFMTIGVVGIGIFFYHAYKFYSRTDYESGWVNLIHVLLVAPLLMVIGFYGKQTSRRFFEMLLMFGFGALGYHGLNVAKTLSNLSE
jgi:hypothetical protein